MKTYHHKKSIHREALSHIQNDQDPEIQEEIGAKALCVDDKEEKESEIKSDREVLQMAEKLHLNMQDLGKGMRSFRNLQFLVTLRNNVICAQTLKKSMHRMHYRCCFAVMVFHKKKQN